MTGEIGVSRRVVKQKRVRTIESLNRRTVQKTRGETLRVTPIEGLVDLRRSGPKQAGPKGYLALLSVRLRA
jgi:hypothetical protein